MRAEGERAAGQERRQWQLAERDGGGAGWWVRTAELEWGMTAIAGGKDGPRRPRGKKDNGKDRRKGGRGDGWSESRREGEVEVWMERNTVGDCVRGGSEVRVGKGETHGKGDE